jgi:hypothetical protein
LASEPVDLHHEGQYPIVVSNRFNEDRLILLSPGKSAKGGEDMSKLAFHIIESQFVLFQWYIYKMKWDMISLLEDLVTF